MSADVDRQPTISCAATGAPRLRPAHRSTALTAAACVHAGARRGPPDHRPAQPHGSLDAAAAALPTDDRSHSSSRRPTRHMEATTPPAARLPSLLSSVARFSDYNDHRLIVLTLRAEGSLGA